MQLASPEGRTLWQSLRQADMSAFFAPKGMLHSSPLASCYSFSTGVHPSLSIPAEVWLPQESRDFYLWKSISKAKCKHLRTNKLNIPKTKSPKETSADFFMLKAQSQDLERLWSSNNGTLALFASINLISKDSEECIFIRAAPP
jgi:hypothetical protein